MSIRTTANAAFLAALLAPTGVVAYNEPGLEMRHGLITTANASMFDASHLSEGLTTYALGWRDPAGYEAASEFLAPALPQTGELYEHFEFPNLEAFLSDGAYDDLRSIGAEFKTVDYSNTKTQREIPNRGLRIVLDWDRIKNMPNWQQYYTGLLMQRLQRNGFRRKVALAVAAGASASVTWGTSADPDYDLVNQAKLSGDASGLQPNRALYGLAAQVLRFYAYGAQATAGAFAGRSMSVEEVGAKTGIDARVDASRYQNGTSKTSIVGSRVILFTATGASPEDPSNFKTAIGRTAAGGRWGVYVRQISTKLWEIVVETYETEFCASTLGVRVVTVS